MTYFSCSHYHNGEVHALDKRNILRPINACWGRKKCIFNEAGRQKSNTPPRRVVICLNQQARCPSDDFVTCVSTKTSFLQVNWKDRTKKIMKAIQAWASNKRLEISKLKYKFPRARNLEIIRLVLGCVEASKQASTFGPSQKRKGNPGIRA